MTTIELICILLILICVLIAHHRTNSLINKYDLKKQKRKKELEQLRPIEIKDIRIGIFKNPYINHKPVSFRILKKSFYHYTVKLLNNNLYNKDDIMYQEWKAGNVKTLAKRVCYF